jgi:uncharacterized lipoprotein YddW (UPF0748 family)
MRARAAVNIALLCAITAAACSDDEPVGPIVEPPDTTTRVEGRALWITRYDWVSPAEITALIDHAAASNFNIIYFQVRGNLDALYQSTIEPWSLRHSAFMGSDPGWDPLQIAITAARAKGLELHAWLNALYAWPVTTPPQETTPRHALLEHPEWFMVNASGQPIYENNTTNRWLSPAVPGARARLAAVAADIARRYGPDGIHLDFIRYPGATPVDSASQAAATAAHMSLDDYRRSAITSAVREVHDSLASAQPAIVLSAAVWGIYDRPWGTTTSSGYEQMMQDPREWARLGIIDVIAPMVYWPIASSYGARTDFAFLATEHAATVSNAHVYVGMSLEHMITNRNVATELSAEITKAREAGAEGVAVFSARLMREQNAWPVLANGVFKQKATVPPR